jgi:hypothetical protein
VAGFFGYAHFVSSGQKKIIQSFGIKHFHLPLPSQKKGVLLHVPYFLKRVLYAMPK